VQAGQPALVADHLLSEAPLHCGLPRFPGTSFVFGCVPRSVLLCSSLGDGHLHACSAVGVEVRKGPRDCLSRVYNKKNWCRNVTVDMLE
jgi:hypothetical protein